MESSVVLDIRESMQGGMYGEGGNVFCPHPGIAFVVKSAAEAWSLSPIQPTLLQSPVYEDKNGDVAAAMQMSHFMSKTIALRRAFFFFFFFWQALNPWPGSPCPPAPPPHSTEMDPANFCQRPALATQPTRRETACALISKIFMSCFG